jgi:glycosyltransferase involved in cell wall biosynthesis
MSLDIIILTKNESKNIIALLENLKGLKGLGKAIVIDDNSTDDTVELAQARGAEIHVHALEDFASQRNFALSKSQADWILFLDADERLTATVKKSLEEHLLAAEPSAGAIKRFSFAFGTRQRFGPLSPDKVVRLFPRGSLTWQGAVHEKALFNVPLKDLKGHLEHYTYSTWSNYLDKMDRYAILWADSAFKAGRTASPFKAVSRAIGAFLKMFWLKLGFLGGPVTWALCWCYSAYTLEKYLRLIQSPNRPKK